MLKYIAVIFGIIISAFILLSIITLSVISIKSSFHYETGKVFTVTGKDIRNTGKESNLLIFTDVTTYEVADSYIWGRWNSADVYGRMEVGKTYEATLQGYRIPFLSMFPNIIDPKVVEETPEEKENK